MKVSELFEATKKSKVDKDYSPLGQLKELPQPIGINGGSYTYWVDVTKSPLKFTASDGAEVTKAKSLEDIAQWMDKWAAQIWLEFLDDKEDIGMLKDEGILRAKKGRGDQQEHEARMREGLNEGAFVIKNKSGKEKRFKNDQSPEAKAWAQSESPKKVPKVQAEKYSNEWWEAKQDASDDYDFITPWKKIGEYELGDGALDDAIKSAGFQPKNIDDWHVTKRYTSDLKGNDVAAADIRVVYVFTKDDDMGIEGDEPVSDSQTIKIVRDPKNPKKFIFAGYK